MNLSLNLGELLNAYLTFRIKYPYSGLGLILESKTTYDKKVVDSDQLTQRLAQGDSAAIEQIYREYFQRLRYYGIQIVGRQSQQMVEDVIQDFFMWLAQHHSKLAKIRNFEVYMFQSIRRNLTSKQRDLQNSQHSFEKYVDTTLPLQKTLEHSPEHVHIQKEENQERTTLIHTELNKLPPYQREILHLRYFEEKSYQEIASILSISDQVAYNYVSRAIKRMKKQLGAFISLLLVLFEAA